MLKNDKEHVGFDQSVKPRKAKFREVSSRFLSPSSTPSIQTGITSPNQALSPVRRKPGSNSTDTRKHRSLEDPGFIRGQQLWPSSSSSAATPSDKNNLDTLADHLGNDRLKEYLDRKNEEKSDKSSGNFLSRQRSCTEISRFENEKESYKENHRPSFGGSMRYTGKLGFPGKSSSSSSVKSKSNDSGILPGRLSVDENALYPRSSRRLSESFVDSLDLESDCSDGCSSTNFSSAANGRSSMSSRKSGIEVSSKYKNDLSKRSRRGTSDSNIPNPLSSDNSSTLKKFTIKNAIRRANSLTGYKSSTTQWALSPGRSGSPPMSVENRGKPMSFSNLKPPNSPSRVKGVEKFLNLGLDFFKSKKSSSSSNSTTMGCSNPETVHLLRLLDNRLIQWQFANARAEAVNRSIANQAQNNLLSTWDGLTKLRQSVLYKKLQFEKEKLLMKLNFIIHSQIKLLESWGDMERQHLSAISMTEKCLHSVVCRVPLIEGAKVDTHSTSIALRHASDITASIESLLTSFSLSAEKTTAMLSELAQIVGQEKLLLEECFELFRAISTLEVQEESLKCSIIQFRCWQQHQPQ
ncbi:QWRF motif-containing protein 3-like [Quillaja saponaria]|uniref:QWRF motif-containing protein 3-like n=1 Tax=Quillaja saponaria TaxID=32244 RepID=A0AAD7KYJ3_QUISA|nr:QWRF motif-containing protein 3-like [Quillaja saponaria]KAJ7948259.1 QWRF motif-containing protein 3-like [Quillaja saponaria]